MTSRLRVTLPVLVIALLLVLVSLTPPPVGAGDSTIVVTLADDLGNGGGDGDCSTNGCTLKEAIILANETPGPSIITFNPQNAPYSIFHEDPGLPEVDATDGITIDGAGANVGIYGYEQASGGGLLFTSRDGQPIKDVVLKNILFDSFQSVAVNMCADVDALACAGDVSNVEIENVSSNLNAYGGLFIAGQAIEDVTIKNFDVTDSPASGANGIRINGGLGLTNITVRDSTLTNVADYGISLEGANGPVDDALVLNNNVSNTLNGVAISTNEEIADAQILDNEVTAASGIAFHGTPVTNPTISNNTITGTAPDGDDLLVRDETTGAVIESNTIQGGHIGIAFFGALGENVISHNTVSGATAAAIALSRGEIVVSRNSTFSNGGIGIDLVSAGDGPFGVLANDPGDADSRVGNPLLNFPEFTGTNAEGITGTACAGCLIELFVSDNHPSGHGEGQEYIKSVVADESGDFTVPICGLNLIAGTRLTATATFDGSTSEFSENLELLVAAPAECPTAAPTETPSTTAASSPTATPGATVIAGDLDCNSRVDPLDALLELLYLQDLLAFGEGCPSPGQSPNGAFSYGDVDCSGSVEPEDAVAILAYFAGLPAPVEEPCSDIGSPI